LALLEVQGITKWFGGLVAVHDLNFNVDRGEIVGMIGPNGAGKTTAFNMIAGFYRPNEGHVYLDGKDITGLRSDQICQLGLARTFQIVRPFKEISVLDNVMVGAYNRTGSERAAQAKAEEIIDFMGMTSMTRQTAAGLPIASCKRLEIARALATNPKIILLDEVMSGLRPTEMDETIDLVRKVNQRGIALLLVEHVMKVIMALAGRIVVIHHGEKLAEGRPDEIVQNKAVIDAYLGEVKTSAAN